MSLLTDASLIVTPNGYNKDKLYSVIPNTTLGDMAVTRATSATRVNEQKLIEIARTNLVLYSEQFDNAYWTKVQGGIALAPVVTPNVETAPDGTMTADRVVFNLNGGTLGTDLSSLGSATFTSISITRTQSVYIKTTDGTTKVFTFVSPIGTATTITVTSVYQRFTWTSTGINVSSIRLRLRGSASGEGTATSASIAIWGAQYEDGSVETEYIPTVASIRTKFAGITQDGGFGSNIPRIDYPPLGGCPSILVEPARTNEISYSEEFDNAIWNKTNIIITANVTATLAPDGSFTADKFIPDATNGGHFISRTGLASYAYTFSVFAKAGEETTFSMWLVNALSISARFDLSTGTYTVTGGATGSMTAFPNGWYRCSVYNATPGTTAHIYGRTGGGFAGDGIKGIFLWGAQVELGSNATSYIPTTTAAVPRDADVIKNLSATTLIGQTEGTMFVDAQITNFAEGAQSFITISDGTITNNRVELRKGSASSQIILEGTALTGTFPGFALSSVAVGRYKIAVAYKTGNTALFINGAQVGITSANTFAFTSLTNIVVGANAIGSTRFLNDRINLATVFKTRLTDDQCILLTGPSFSSYPEMANNFPNTLIYSLQ